MKPVYIFVIVFVFFNSMCYSQVPPDYKDLYNFLNNKLGNIESYIDFNEDTKNLKPCELFQFENKAALINMLAQELSETGVVYKNIIEKYRKTGY